MSKTLETQKAAEERHMRIFTNWINSKLRRAKQLPTKDMIDDMKNGKILYHLLVALGKQPPSINEKSELKIVAVENLSLLVKFITNDLGLKLVNIGPEDIHYGERKLILGLIWTMILNLSIENIRGDEIENKVFEWAKRVTKDYDNVSITNLGAAFSDGLAFNAIHHHYHPDEIDYNKLDKCNSLHNLKHAFDFAEGKGVESLIDLEDYNSEYGLDKKSVFPYLIELYLHYLNIESCIDDSNTIKELLIKLDKKIEEEKKYKVLLAKINNDKEEYYKKCADISEKLEKLKVEMINANKMVGEIIKGQEDAYKSVNDMDKHLEYNIKVEIDKSGLEFEQKQIISNFSEELAEFNSIKKSLDTKLAATDLSSIEIKKAFYKEHIKRIFTDKNVTSINVENSTGKKLENLPENVSLEYLTKFLKE